MEDNLSEVFTASWGKLLFGSMIAEHPYHTGVVASQGNSTINLRTVILRAVDPDNKQLVFYTDIRSAKITDIQNSPNLSWLFYDSTECIQVRVSGAAIIHHMDTVTQEHWERLRNESRKSYMAIPGPSAGIEHDTDGLEHLDEDNMDWEAGYINFAVIVTTVSFVEWLRLSKTGNRRAEFRLINDGWKGQWLIP